MAAAEVLYVRGGPIRKLHGGADVVSATVFRMLTDYFGAGAVEGFYLDELAPLPGRATVLRRTLGGEYERYSGSIRRLLAERAAGKRLVFVDQSVYGLACSDARRAEAACAIAVLFHNNEWRYYRGLVLRAGRVQNLLMLPAIVNAERRALATADLAIALSERDAQALESDYGRKPELVLPAAVADHRARRPEAAALPREPFTMLFVGSAFPPNLAGVRWFVRKVLPAVDGRLIVVGREFEKYRQELQGPRCEVVGFADDTGPYFDAAHCVVSPIFWGSGIKVKTAEAFMEGKLVVGTREAFEGYDAARAGALVANRAGEFIAALAAVRREGPASGFHAPARAYYEKELSYESQYRRMAEALDGILASSNSTKDRS
jgi:hypothetical protein